MTETPAHQRAKAKAAGKGGSKEVKVGQKRLDALTASKKRVTEVERSGNMKSLKAATRREDIKKNWGAIDMTEAEKKILNLFVEKAEELKGCALLQARHKLSFSIKVAGTQGVVKTSLPNEEQLRSFLLVLRNFYFPGEDIHFPKVCQILINNLEDKDMKRRVGEVAVVYEGILARSPVSFVEEDTPLTPNELLRRWLYGFYHHTDRRKREKVEKWGFVAGLTKMQFISTVFDLAKCVIWLDGVAKDYIDGKTK